MFEMIWIRDADGRLVSMWIPAKSPARGSAPTPDIVPGRRFRGAATVKATRTLACLMALGGGAASAQDAPPEKKAADSPATLYQVNGQATFILQNLFKFRSPYEGASSLRSREEAELSHTYTLYLGARIRPNLEVYIDPEMARGRGVSEALGLAGYTNGEVIRNPSLSQEPYLARYFVRWTTPTGPGSEKVEGAQNQVAGTRPSHRLVFSFGKVSTADFFDLNSYANSPRTQFMNWSLLNNGAYDYAADTRGYTIGFALEWIHPGWALRVGSFQMPEEANGIQLASYLPENRGDQIELELHPWIAPGEGARNRASARLQ